MKHFDAIIIGTGQAGPSLAGRFAGAGKTVAIIERHKFGGTCVNTGCIPTKADAQLEASVRIPSIDFIFKTDPLETSKCDFAVMGTEVNGKYHEATKG